MKTSLSLVFIALAFLVGCGDDGTEAVRLGVGAECVGDDDCNTDEGHRCLGFKGGYCGVPDCASDEDCPAASKCVIHDTGENYCFLSCTDKSQCNENRSVDNEANCSSNITFTDDDNVKACIPPS